MHLRQRWENCVGKLTFNGAGRIYLESSVVAEMREMCWKVDFKQK